MDDFRGDPPRTLVNWEAALQREYDEWFPFRTPVTISQLRATGLYPDTGPPAFNQHGGLVPPGFGLQITNDGGDVYYTTDGSDPRLAGGAVNPAAIHIAGTLVDFTSIAAGSDWKYNDDGVDLGTAWRATDFDDSAWAAGLAPLGYGGINNTTIATTINAPRHVTAYFRKSFEVTNAALTTEASLRIHADGGAVVYINGTEAVRDNIPDGTISFGTLSVNDGNEGVFDSYTFDHSLLVDGSNTIAVEVHNGSTSSSDMVIDLALEGIRLNESNAPIALNATTTVRARSLDGGEWSALTEATFLTGTLAAPGNLVISEIHYHPSTAQGELSEYVELMNISDQTINLAGVAFTRGITFTFDDQATIAPRQRAMLVADQAAFEAVHSIDKTILGTYTGRLADGGERLTLSAPDGSPLRSLRFDDTAPWPTEADGDGYSLALISPESAPDHTLPQNWRASLNPGGSPGASDAITFGGDPATELLAYALGGDGASSVGIGSIAGVPVFEFPRALGADDVEFSVELSGDLVTWRAGEATLLDQSERAEGGSLSIMRWSIAAGAAGRQYARLVVSLRE